jgi:hypothetical protein
MDLNWDAIGASAELLGAMGVIATLVYLARQIIHNSDQLRGSATTAVFEYQRSLIIMLIDNPELYKIAMRGNEDWDSLDTFEQQQYTLYCIHETGMWEMCYRLLAQGALDEQLYLGKEAYWLELHSSPGRRVWWNNHTIMLSQDFHQAISKKLLEIPVEKLRNTNPVFDSSIHEASDQ